MNENDGRHVIGGEHIPQIEIRNLVASAKMATRFDLDVCHHRLQANAARRNPAWVGLRLGSPSRYVALYPQGRALVTGARSEAEAQTVLLSLCDFLRARAIPDLLDEPSDYKVHNIVATANLPDRVDLSQLSGALDPDQQEYEPEQFPGLIFHSKSGARGLIFASGRLVLTGAKTSADLESMLREITRKLSWVGA